MDVCFQIDKVQSREASLLPLGETGLIDDDLSVSPDVDFCIIHGLLVGLFVGKAVPNGRADLIKNGSVAPSLGEDHVVKAACWPVSAGVIASTEIEASSLYARAKQVDVADLATSVFHVFHGEDGKFMRVVYKAGLCSTR